MSPQANPKLAIVITMKQVNLKSVLPRFFKNMSILTRKDNTLDQELTEEAIEAALQVCFDTTDWVIFAEETDLEGHIC